MIGGVGSQVGIFDLTAGMASANKVKGETARPGTTVRVLAIGVGSGITVGNLSAVSGPVEGIEGDFANPTIDELSAALDEYAAAQCGARVYVRKLLAGDQTNQAGWYYTATDPRPGFTPSYLDDDRSTHPSGIPPVVQTGAFFQKLPPTPTTVTIAEDAAGQPLSSFDLTDITCRDDGFEAGPVVAGTRNGLAYDLAVNEGDDVYCTFTNEPLTTLTIDKTPNDQTINAGEDAAFTIQVTNTGVSAATNSTLTDTLPAPGVGGWSITSQPGGDPCTVVGNNLNCSFGTIPAGESRTVTVKTGTSFAACGVYDNPVASASADNADTVSDAGKITCIKPNLTVDKTGNGTVNAGQDVQFSIVTSNGGPGTAKSVNLSDTLPSGTAGAWVIDTQPGGNPCSITGNLLTCSFGDLASGQSRTVTVKAATNYAHCTVYDNTATATATNHPNVPDGASVTCQKPNLTVDKTGNGKVNAGQDVRFTISVRNGGPGTARSVTLSDPLPGGTAGGWKIASQPSGEPCSISGGSLKCSFGDLSAGDERTVKVKAPTSNVECSVYENTATAIATNSPKASDDATVRCVPPKPNVVLKKTADRKKVFPGDTVRYSIWYRNTVEGSVARNLEFCDRLPDQMTIVDTNGGFFQDGRICWSVEELGYSKDWVHFHFLAKVNEGVGRGTRLKNVVTLGKKKASWTIVVKRPQGVKTGGGGKTPVTG